MERAAKSIGKRHKLDDDQNVDRLSDLPDGVICHILSFLPTRTSVQTSVLAKRWRYTWAHVPSIDLFDVPNSDSESESEEEYGTSKKNATFSKIVCKVVLRHKAKTLNTFRLKSPEYGPCTLGRSELESCIATIVVERNVQNLYLERLRVEVPRCLWTCKSLVDLNLSDAIVPDPSSSGPIYLPNLKKLRFFFLGRKVDFTRLISGCPVLEDLYIQGTMCSDLRGCYISSPTLKRLTAKHLLESDMFDNPDYMMTINTPALRYLEVHERSSKHISVSPCTSLVEANIIIGSLDEPDDFNPRWVLKLLDIVRNVESLNLRLTGSCRKICDGLVPAGPIAKFGNLTQLRYSANCRFLSKFLQSADRLQVLDISFEKGYSKHWIEPTEERHCACLFYSLRIVRMNDFRNQEQSFNMVRYILRNARVLERMEINWYRWGSSFCLKEKYDAIHRIELFPRGSVECEMAFT